MADKFLVCNTNSLGHTDFAQPISVHLNRGSDYRTSYQTAHSWHPPVGQDFLNRANRKISTNKHVVLKKDHYQTDYSRHFPPHAVSKNPDQMVKPPICTTINYLTSFEQKIFNNPPRPIMPPQSEAKSAYTVKPHESNEQFVFPPNPYRICPIKGINRDEQPPLIPEKNGAMKLLDIYLSTNRATYVPYDEIQQRGIARKDIVTYFDASGVPRGGKGYGPKEDTRIQPLTIVKKPEPIPKNKKWSTNHMQTLPNRAFKSETAEMYSPHTKSELHPYNDMVAATTFPTISYNSPWVNLSVPNMYCTEYCHMGTGYPINAAVELKDHPRLYRHNIGCKC